MPALRYALNGVQLASELPFPLRALRPLAPSSVTAPDDVRLVLGDVAVGEVRAWELRDSGLSFGRVGDLHVIRHGDAMTFEIDASERTTRVTCDRPSATPELVVEQIFLDQILPLVLHVRGRFSFHGSAATVDGLAVGFLGESGRGKSTLASSLASFARGPSAPGEALLSDDCLAVEVDDAAAYAHPSYASARLWPPSADALFAARGPLPTVSPRSSKRRVELTTRRERTRLARIYLLEVGDGDVVIERARPAAAIFALAKHLFRLDPEGREPLARELAFLDALVSRAPVATLTYRRDFAELDRVRDAIRADITKRPG